MSWHVVTSDENLEVTQKSSESKQTKASKGPDVHHASVLHVASNIHLNTRTWKLENPERIHRTR